MFISVLMMAFSRGKISAYYLLCSDLKGTVSRHVNIHLLMQFITQTERKQQQVVIGYWVLTLFTLVMDNHTLTVTHTNTSQFQLIHPKHCQPIFIAADFYTLSNNKICSTILYVGLLFLGLILKVSENKANIRSL